MARAVLEGGCHCGAIRVALTLTVEPAEAAVRACGCSFCRSHGARTVTDPDGHLAISLTEPDLLERYRFDAKTADFLICRRCGVYVAALIETPAGLRATLNVNTLDQRGRFAKNPPMADYSGESREARVLRRATAWTPATLDQGPQ